MKNIQRNKDEILDIFDFDGNWVGTIERKFAHKDGGVAYHKAVHIWFINRNGEVLVQKRAKYKAQSPSKWDIPSAGHVDAGEDLLTACERETFEELGIKLPRSAFKEIIVLKKHRGQTTGEFQCQYLVVNDTKIKDMILQEKEVEEVKWLKLEEFKKLLYSDEFVAHQKDFKDTVLNFISDAISGLKIKND